MRQEVFGARKNVPTRLAEWYHLKKSYRENRNNVLSVITSGSGFDVFFRKEYI